MKFKAQTDLGRGQGVQTEHTKNQVWTRRKRFCQTWTRMNRSNFMYEPDQSDQILGCAPGHAGQKSEKVQTEQNLPTLGQTRRTLSTLGYIKQTEFYDWTKPNRPNFGHRPDRADQ